MSRLIDADKVVEELNDKLSEKRYQHEDEDYYVGIGEAVDIVSNAEEEICEWIEYAPMDKCFYRYYLGCKEDYIQFHNKTSYKYCPYCGRKIKVAK